MNPNPKLKGQSALVTGANSGIGLAVAIALLMMVQMLLSIMLPILKLQMM